METNAVNLSLVWDCDPLRIEVKQCESPLGEHPESRAVSDYSEPSVGGRANAIGVLCGGVTAHL